MPPYNVRLGPLRFTSPMDNVSRTLGEALENVGAALVPTQRRPKPLKLKLPVEGNPHVEADPKAAGDRLRRQVEQLFDNRRWMSQGLYLYWEVGDLLAAWVLVGGGELTEQDPGIGFGMYTLDLTDLYIVGTPGTHRPGRRLDLVDRRLPTVPRDTRGLLYTDAFADTPTINRLVIPGSAQSLRNSSGQVRQVNYGGVRLGPIADARYPWLLVGGGGPGDALDGEVITYTADRFQTDLDPRRAIAELDDFTSVKAWDQNLDQFGGGYSYDPLATAADQDYQPDLSFGWERLFGTPSRTDRYLALENGSIRLRWLGGGVLGPGVASGGLVFEWWDELTRRYRPEGRFLHWASGSQGNYGYEVTIVELTPERGILEVRLGPRCLRAILQRGWPSVRLESYSDTAGNDFSDLARLEWGPVAPASDVIIGPAGDPPHAWVKDLLTPRADPRLPGAIRVAPAADTYLFDPGSPSLLDTAGACIYQNEVNAPNVVVVQVAPPWDEFAGELAFSTPDELAALSLVDARSVPVVVPR